jgi:hypothetical protein
MFKKLGDKAKQAAQQAGQAAKSKLEEKIQESNLDVGRFVGDFSNIQNTMNNFGLENILDLVTSDTVMVSMAAIVYTYGAEGIDKVKQEVMKRIVDYDQYLDTQVVGHPEKVGFWDGFVSVYRDEPVNRAVDCPQYQSFSQVGRMFGYITSPLTPAPVAMLISKLDQFNKYGDSSDFLKGFIEQKVGSVMSGDLINILDKTKNKGLEQETTYQPQIQQTYQETYQQLNSEKQAPSLKDQYKQVWNMHYQDMPTDEIKRKQELDGVPQELKDILVKIAKQKYK